MTLSEILEDIHALSIGTTHNPIQTILSLLSIIHITSIFRQTLSTIESQPFKLVSPNQTSHS